MKFVIILLLLVFKNLATYGMENVIEDLQILRFDAKELKKSVEHISNTGDICKILIQQIKLIIFCLERISYIDFPCDHPIFRFEKSAYLHIKDPVQAKWIGVFLTIINSLTNHKKVNINSWTAVKKQQELTYFCSIALTIQLFFDDLGYTALNNFNILSKKSVHLLVILIKNNIKKLNKLLGLLLSVNPNLSEEQELNFCYLYAYIIYVLNLPISELPKKLKPRSVDAIPFFYHFDRYLSLSQHDLIEEMYTILGLYKEITL